MEQELLDILRTKACREMGEGIVIREPYIPYLPKGWNGMLVLAESQNLSAANEAYVDELMRLDPTGRMKRLGHPELYEGADIGVAPWDDGSLKLAVEAAFGAIAERTGVSNAVLWSQRDPNTGANSNPDAHLQELSSVLWRDMLEIIQPERVICSGNIAHRVVCNAVWTGGRIDKVRLPSPNGISRVSGMFGKTDLLKRYPEVRKVAEAHPEWLKSHRHNKIFFACHAVSLHAYS